MISWLKQLARIMGNRRRFEGEVDEELDFHLQSRADQLQSASISRAEALRRARIELGMVESHRDQIRRSRGLAPLDWLMADLRLAWRALRKTPMFSLTAVAVLAFPLATGLLLHALYTAYAVHSPSFDRVEHWVHLYGDSVNDRRQAQFTAREAELLLAAPPPGIEGLYSSRAIRQPLVTDRVQRGVGVAVSPNYFSLTGVPAARGRVFDPNDEGEANLIVLSDRGWARLFNRAEDAIGESVSIGGREFKVIGIAGRQFRGTNEVSAHYWMRESDHRRGWPNDKPTQLTHEVSGFIHPDVSVAAAGLALNARVASFNRERDPQHELHAVGVEPALGYLRADDRLVLKIALTPVTLMVVLMLVIAAANLTNLVLARFSARRHDTALRAALGASRLRMFAQLMTECGMIGLAAAALALGLLATLMQPMHNWLFSFMAELGLDPISIGLGWPSIIVAVVLAMLATLLFGALPAWLVTGASAAHQRTGSADAALKRAGSSRLRAILMVTQLAASVFLVVVAAMISGVAGKTETTPLGYDPQMLVSIDASDYPVALSTALLRSPLIREVAGTSTAPLMGESERRSVVVDGRSATVLVRYVDQRWFELLGQQPLRGRLLEASDALDGPAALLSHTAARMLWPDRDPLGQSLRLSAPKDDERAELAAQDSQAFDVVGVIPDIASGFMIRGQEQPVLYLPAQLGDPPLSILMLQLTDTSAQSLAQIYEICIQTQPQAYCRPLRLNEALRIQQLPFQIARNVAAGLGWIALSITCLGLYGLVSYTIVQRRREIGVRLALGAQPARVVREVMRASLMQIGLGIALGIPMAFALTRLIAIVTSVFDLVDARAFIAAPLLLAFVAAFAAWLPARQSAQIAPSEALRHER